MPPWTNSRKRNATEGGPSRCRSHRTRLRRNNRSRPAAPPIRQTNPEFFRPSLPRQIRPKIVKRIRSWLAAFWRAVTFPSRALWWFIDLPARALRSARAFMATDPEEHPLGEVIVDLTRNAEARQLVLGSGRGAAGAPVARRPRNCVGGGDCLHVSPTAWCSFWQGRLAGWAPSRPLRLRSQSAFS